MIETVHFYGLLTLANEFLQGGISPTRLGNFCSVTSVEVFLEA